MLSFPLVFSKKLASILNVFSYNNWLFTVFTNKFFLLLLPFTIVVSRVMPFISFSLNAVCGQAQGVFLVFLACMRTHSHGCSWALFLCQNRGASDYGLILKWCPFYFQPPALSPECSTLVHLFVLVCLPVLFCEMYDKTSPVLGFFIF